MLSEGEIMDLEEWWLCEAFWLIKYKNKIYLFFWWFYWNRLKKTKILFWQINQPRTSNFATKPTNPPSKFQILHPIYFASVIFHQNKFQDTGINYKIFWSTLSVTDPTYPLLPLRSPFPSSPLLLSLPNRIQLHSYPFPPSCPHPSQSPDLNIPIA